MKGRGLAAAAAAAFAIIATPAHAWGDRGHRAIADIAWVRLTPQTRAQIARLLQHIPELGTPMCPVGSFEDAATWSDCVRSAYHDRFAATSTWHYVDVPLCAPFSLPVDPEARFIVERFGREERILGDQRRNDVDRLEALLWVEHLAGDLHQPLHIAGNGDRGGNAVAVVPQHGRYPLSLHGEWDRELVEAVISEIPAGVGGMAAEAGESTTKAASDAAAWARES